MLQSYLDAMAMCKWYGYPDLFITFRCNPKWPEITRYLKRKGLKSEDRSDVTSHVFKMKLDQMINDIKEMHIFGRVKAEVYTIKFQKQGLPYCHLVTAAVEDEETDEIKDYYDCRYLSSCEAAWRIFNFDIHHRSPAVERLPFHLPNQQSVVFDPTESIDFQLEKVSANTSKFLAWMERNQTDKEARKLGAQKWEDLREFDDVVYPTCKDACFARGLLEDDKEYIDGIIEASDWGMGDYLRNYFVINIVNMPYPDSEFTMEGYNRLIYDELDYKIPDLILHHRALYASLTNEKKLIYETIVDTAENNKGGMFFVYGYGGIGKTFLYKTLTAALRSKRQIVLNIAYNDIASLLLDGGRTPHSWFAIPINVVEDSMCIITADSDLADLIRETKLIIWDEAPMINRLAFEAFDRTPRDIATGKIGGKNDGHAEVEFPKEMLIPDSDDHVGSVIKEVYDDWEKNMFDPTYFQDRAIFAPTHEHVDEVNNRMMVMIPGREKVHYSSDTVTDNPQKDNHEVKSQKCTFGMREGMFLGYKMNVGGLKVCSDKVEAVLSLPSPKYLKDVQKLNGKLASLNRFLYKSTEKSLPIFKILKKCIKKSDFQWTAEAETAVKQMKKSIVELPMLTAPKEKEELIIYLAAAKEAISAVLMTERDGKQMPIYFVSRALQGPKTNYTPMEKLILALDTPMEDEEALLNPWILFIDGSSCIDGSGASLIITNLEGRNFTYALRFRFDATNNEAEYEALIAGLRIAEQMGIKNLQANVDSRLVANQVNGTYITKEPGMIKYLEKVKDLACRFKEFSIKQVPREENKKADALSNIASTSFAHLSKHVLVEELKEKSIDEKEVLMVVKEEGRTWMTLIHEYLTKEILPEENRKARAIRRKARRYAITNGVLYKRFGLPGEIISNNGKQFRDNPFKDWCEKLCIRQCFASVKRPQANGLVERANRSLCEGIKVRLDEKSKIWIEEISHVLWAHRTMIKSSNRETPFSLMYGTKAVIPVEIGIPTLRIAKVDMIKSYEDLEINLDLLEEKREQAAIQEATSKAMMEKYYNARVRNTSFKP
nr:hypothetical protein [Tanacetum cinerariifolium]